MTRFVRRLLGLLLLPLAWALTRAALDMLPAALLTKPPWVSAPLLAMLTGYGFWLIIFLFLPPPVRAYIWAHELTHAIWGLLSGARVGPIRVHSGGGSVQLTHAGVFTTLAPYFVPFYTVLVILLRLLLGLFLDMNRFELPWLFLVGLTWGFHLTFTLRSLTQRQPDILEFGRVFSHVLIYLFNVLGLGLWIVCVTSATLPAFGVSLTARSRAAYVQSAQTIGGLTRQVINALGGEASKISRKRLIEDIQYEEGD